MANEFKHKDPCTTLTQCEYIGADGTGHIFACQATGDILYASSATVLKNLGRGNQNEILSMGGSNIPAWTATPTLTSITVSGAASSTITSTNDAACAIYLRTNAGTSETIKIHADQGTSESSIQLLSDAGGVNIDAATGKDVDIAGGTINLTSSDDAGSAVYIRANAGTSETIKIHADQGSGEGSIELTSDAGGIDVNAATGKDIDVAGGTINLTSSDDAGSAIYLRANAGTSETIKIHADQGNGAASICLTSDAGGITLTPSSAVTVSGGLTVGVCGTGHDVKFFGDTAGAFMLYDQSCDQLEIRGASANAATSTGKLLLTTAQTAVDACDVIGSISFQAPLECGTDAVKVSASITAVAQGTFAANVNATDIIFYTAHDNCVAERFRFTSQGEIGIAGANYGSDGQVLTSSGGGTAVAWEDAGGCFDGTLDADLSFTGTQKIISTSNGSISIIPHGTGAIGIGSCAGVNAAIRINPAAFTATACAVAYRTSFDGANAMTVPSGTSAIAANINVGEPNITATGTVTTGTTVRIAGPPTEGTNNYSLLVCSGAVRFVGQPMVTAFNSAIDCNATGAGTEAAVDFNTETFDQGCNFASDAFTAPQTGKYLVASHVRMQGITSGMNRGLLYFKSSNRNYVYAANHLGNIRACGNEIGMQGTAIVDMDKCDTLSVSAYAFGGSDVADISGTSYPITWVSIGMIA